MPEMYDDLWTAAKGMYKLEPAIADGGEVVIYAPHITEVSYTHGAHHRRGGLPLPRLLPAAVAALLALPRRRARALDAREGPRAVRRGERRGVAAHPGHAGDGHPEERCRRINLGYLDPATVNVEDWTGREGEGVLVVPRAGEMLYRLKAAAQAGA